MDLSLAEEDEAEHQAVEQQRIIRICYKQVVIALSNLSWSADGRQLKTVEQKLDDVDCDVSTSSNFIGSGPDDRCSTGMALAYEDYNIILARRQSFSSRQIGLLA